MIDGALEKWKLDPPTAEVPSYRKTEHKVNGINAAFRADRESIKERLGTAGFSMVDVRSPAEHQGERRPAATGFFTRR